MRGGQITCECGQLFYFETVRDTVNCIKCGKKHDVSGFGPIVPEETEDETELRDNESV